AGFLRFLGGASPAAPTSTVSDIVSSADDRGSAAISVRANSREHASLSASHWLLKADSRPREQALSLRTNAVMVIAKRLLPFALSAVVVGCASQPAAVNKGSAEDQIRVAEQEVTRLMTHRGGTRSAGLIAEGFRCTVQDANGPMSMGELVERTPLCVTYGHRQTHRADQPEWLQHQTWRNGDRVAESETLDFKVNGDTATVVTLQTFQRWWPYDGTWVRRSHVTDTWVQRDGRWQLLKRVSEPLENDQVVHSARN
ncbi:MAG TPA: nuclear transport factor 2 family protein, partial [Thermoanaerobaculia bacterium]|nr:nuclear transport factor 2 family protein [Thermoanaerobaculia bacterium]